MRTAICTISTQGHLFKAKALFHSLQGLTDASFYCLITDSKGNPKLENNFKILSFKDLNSEKAEIIKSKYKGDKLRWACKPLLLIHLLERGIEKVIYVDNDIYFYKSTNFIFEHLEENSVLLTPHFYLADPTQRQYWLEANFRVGLYNGGFIGVNKDALSALHWWAACCEYNVKKASWRGLFDDQKYLDLLPILFDSVFILKHKGCNVASWNIDLCSRTLNEKNEVLLDSQWPLIFIHFNGFTLRAIRKGLDPFLEPHLSNYFKVLKNLNQKFKPIKLTSYNSMDGLNFLRHLWWYFVRKFD
jgi:hypothetical protein